MNKLTNKELKLLEKVILKNLKEYLLDELRNQKRLNNYRSLISQVLLKDRKTIILEVHNLYVKTITMEKLSARENYMLKKALLAQKQKDLEYIDKVEKEGKTPILSRNFVVMEYKELFKKLKLEIDE